MRWPSCARCRPHAAPPRPCLETLETAKRTPPPHYSPTIPPLFPHYSRQSASGVAPDPGPLCGASMPPVWGVAAPRGVPPGAYSSLISGFLGVRKPSPDGAVLNCLWNFQASGESLVIRPPLRTEIEYSTNSLPGWTADERHFAVRPGPRTAPQVPPSPLALSCGSPFPPRYAPPPPECPGVSRSARLQPCTATNAPPRGVQVRPPSRRPTEVRSGPSCATNAALRVDVHRCRRFVLRACRVHARVGVRPGRRGRSPSRVPNCGFFRVLSGRGENPAALAGGRGVRN